MNILVHLLLINGRTIREGCDVVYGQFSTKLHDVTCPECLARFSALGVSMFANLVHYSGVGDRETQCGLNPLDHGVRSTNSLPGVTCKTCRIYASSTIAANKSL